MRIDVYQSAPDEHSDFDRDAFVNVIGKRVPFRAPGYNGTADLIAAEVAKDGRSATLAVEIADSSYIAVAIRDMGCGAHFDGQAFSLTGWVPAERARD